LLTSGSLFVPRTAPGSFRSSDGSARQAAVPTMDMEKQASITWPWVVLSLNLDAPHYNYFIWVIRVTTNEINVGRLQP
jgi:hypothetical protein